MRDLVQRDSMLVNSFVRHEHPVHYNIESLLSWTDHDGETRFLGCERPLFRSVFLAPSSFLGVHNNLSLSGWPKVQVKGDLKS